MKNDRSILVHICLLGVQGIIVMGACPNDLTPVIDICDSTSSFTGVGAYIDSVGMASGHSKCSCSVSSTGTQNIQYHTMELGQNRQCAYYNYNILFPVDDISHTWTCANPSGYSYHDRSLDPTSPWVVTIEKTELGLSFAPLVDPGYCVILVAGSEHEINISCGNATSSTTPTTSEGPTKSTLASSTVTTTDATSTGFTLTTQTASTSTSTDTSESQTSATTSGTTTTAPASGTTTTAPASGTTTTVPASGTTTTTAPASGTTTTVPASGTTTTVPASGTTPSGGSESTQLTSAPGAISNVSTFTSTLTPERFVGEDVQDSGIGVIIGGIFAGVLLFFLVAGVCYFYNRHVRQRELEEERVHETSSDVTSTTDETGYPYRKPGDYVYYVDTSAASQRDYVYLYSQ